MNRRHRRRRIEINTSCRIAIATGATLRPKVVTIREGLMQNQFRGGATPQPAMALASLRLSA
jgi:hypothetical protein